MKTFVSAYIEMYGIYMDVVAMIIFSKYNACFFQIHITDPYSGPKTWRIWYSLGELTVSCNATRLLCFLYTVLTSLSGVYIWILIVCCASITH